MNHTLIFVVLFAKIRESSQHCLKSIMKIPEEDVKYVQS